jgi:glyoxylase-like metal-dependent hydrolase (beta-lactamase superfamily II)
MNQITFTVDFYTCNMGIEKTFLKGAIYMLYRIISDYRICLAAVVVGLLFVSLSSVWAEAPLVGEQSPGFYRMMLGQFEVTALYDGNIDLDSHLLLNASESEVQTLLSRAFIDGPKLPSSVNTYLINTGSKLVLVDSGAGNLFGPTLGNVVRNLKAAGYNPSQVDAVLITHMHGDHIGGLRDADGKPAFPNAVIHVSKIENDFWLSAAEAEKAPADMKMYFKMAHDLADPAIATGKWKTFQAGEQPVSGIKAVSIPGHTPGHTAFEVNSGKESLLIVGDLIHCMAAQFPRPDIALTFDIDKKEAVSTRQAIFKTAAEKKTLVAGMHLPFPGIGRLRAEEKGGYTWMPIEYSPVRK